MTSQLSLEARLSRAFINHVTLFYLTFVITLFSAYDQIFSTIESLKTISTEILNNTVQVATNVKTTLTDLIQNDLNAAKASQSRSLLTEITLIEQLVSGLYSVAKFYLKGTFGFPVCLFQKTFPSLQTLSLSLPAKAQFLDSKDMIPDFKKIISDISLIPDLNISKQDFNVLPDFEFPNLDKLFWYLILGATLLAILGNLFYLYFEYQKHKTLLKHQVTNQVCSYLSQKSTINQFTPRKPSLAKRALVKRVVFLKQSEWVWFKDYTNHKPSIAFLLIGLALMTSALIRLYALSKTDLAAEFCVNQFDQAALEFNLNITKNLNETISSFKTSFNLNLSEIQRKLDIEMDQVRSVALSIKDSVLDIHGSSQDVLESLPGQAGTFFKGVSECAFTNKVESIVLVADRLADFKFKLKPIDFEIPVVPSISVGLKKLFDVLLIAARNQAKRDLRKSFILIGLGLVVPFFGFIKILFKRRFK